MPSKRTGIFRDCPTCGISFYVAGSRIKTLNYCSRKCASDGRSCSLEERFWQYIEPSEDCWNWTGPRNDQGYGRLWLGPTVKRFRVAHRFSWELHFGEIPDGLDVCHHCDNPACSRPDHLFLGTTLDNMADMVAKERGRSGKAKLTEDQVREIRLDYSTPMTILATRYGLSPHAISAIRRGLSWKHVHV